MRVCAKTSQPRNHISDDQKPNPPFLYYIAPPYMNGVSDPVPISTPL